MTGLLPYVAVLAAFVAGAVLLARWWRQRDAAALTARIDQLAATGDLKGAARLAADSGRLDVAFELYVRGRELFAAATIAVRRNDLRRAANLFEQVGDWAQAIDLYDKVGLHRHADNLRKNKLEAPPPPIVSLRKPTAQPDGGEPAPPAPAPVTTTAVPAAGAPFPDIVPLTPVSLDELALPPPRRALSLDDVELGQTALPTPVMLDEAMRQPPPPPPLTTASPPPLTTVPPPPPLTTVPPPLSGSSTAAPRTATSPPAAAGHAPGRAEAGALLAEGDITGAAELFAELGLDDEATHLWVNVLGEPERAAPLVAARGNHERAAELYLLAGDHERAARAWVDAARASPRPEAFLDRIVELSPEVALAYLEQEVAARPLSPAHAEWHYEKARAVDRGGDARRAITLDLALQDEVPGYRDVDLRLDELSRALQPPTAASRVRRSTRAPIDLPPDLDGEGAAPHEAAPAPPPPEPELEPAPAIELDGDQLLRLTSQLTGAVLDQVRRRSKLETLPAPDSGPTRVPAEERAAGLESAPLDPAVLDDGAVDAARRGPTLEALRQLTGGRPCDLGNIEVFYRIALAHQAAGNFDEALATLEIVSDVSPGYRDTWKRIDDLGRWKQAMATAALPAGDGGADRDRYELRGELGRGAIAVVYRAFDRRLGRDVALKLLSEALSSQQPVRELFLARARALAGLTHPNLITVHDSGVLAGRAFIAMELVDGQSVAALLREPGGLTIVESLRIMKQALDGLGRLHGAGLVHHELAPSRVVRTASGLVKVMDLGLAVPRGEGQRPAIIGAATAYLAPELTGGGEVVDARADVFSASATLYEMLAGQPAYTSGDRRTAPARLSALAPSVPAQLEAAVMRGLAVDRGERFRTAAELSTRLGAILAAVNAFVASRGRRARPRA